MSGIGRQAGKAAISPIIACLLCQRHFHLGQPGGHVLFRPPLCTREGRCAMLTACTSCSIPMFSTPAYAHPAVPRGLSLSCLWQDTSRLSLPQRCSWNMEERLCGDATLHGLGLTDADLVAFLDELVARSRRVRLYWLWRPVAPDPDDDMVIECAVNGHAEAIVTFNTRDLQPAQDCFGILVLTPAAFLARFGRQA